MFASKLGCSVPHPTIPPAASFHNSFNCGRADSRT
jgi:hypothetical protein